MTEIQPSYGAKVVRAELDFAHTVLRALGLAGHIPEGAWRRVVDDAIALESEGDVADSNAVAAAVIWNVEQSDRIMDKR